MVKSESVVVYFFFEKHVSIPMVNSSRVAKMAMIFHHWMAYPIRLDEAFILCSNLPLPSSSPVFQFSQASLQTPKHFAQAISAFGRHRRWQEGHLLLDEMTRYRWLNHRVNYSDLTVLPSPGIMVSKRNHPKIALFQVSELL